ncbi:hypothetical protein MPSEU_000773800 [Mayamaea pseudoterrestris]|nr:hypothetical protein MPSEU_000773800 [Mayamaea pseudoterrestris]
MSAIQVHAGDFVEIAAPHPEKGKRGFVRFEPFDQDDANANFGVVIDEYKSRPIHQDNQPQPHARTIFVPCNQAELVRQHDKVVTTRIADFRSSTFPCYGKIGSSFAQAELLIDPELPHGKLARPSAQDLSGKPPFDSFFKTVEAEALYNDIYAGNFIAKWSHSFQHPLDGTCPPFMFNLPWPALCIHVYEMSEADQKIASFTFSKRGTPRHALRVQVEV